MTVVELLERESALAELDRAAASAITGEGRMVLVEGPAGIGKSALVEAFLRRYDGPVLFGACDDLSIPQVLAPFEDIVRDDPTLEGAFEDGLVTFRRAFLKTLAREPAVVVVEDVHWADEATIDMLSFLARRLGGLGAVIVVTVRTGLAMDHPVARLLAAIPPGLAIRVALTELSRTAVGRLAEAAAHDAADIYEVTGGNPFLVTELLVWGEPVPATVAESVSARIASLPGAARDVAALLSVMPGQTGWEFVEHLLPSAADSLADLEFAGIITSTPEGISYRHELLRRAVAERLSQTERRRLNRTVLDSLLARAAPPSRIAHHAAEAGDPDVLLRYGRAAIDEAISAGAHGQALAHVDNLVPLADRLPGAEEADLWHTAALEYWRNNDIRSASTAIWKAIELWERLDEPNALGRDLGHAATFASHRSRPVEGARLRQRAISILEPLGPSRELAREYVIRGQDLSLRSRLPEALAWFDKGIQSSDRDADDDILALALGAREPVRVMMGDGDAARSDGDLAIEICVRRHLYDQLGATYTNRIAASINALHLEHVEDDIRTALDFGDDLDLARFSTTLTMQTGRLYLLRGRWDEAREASDCALERVPAGTSRVTALLVRALLQGRIGDQSATETLREAAEAMADSDDIQRWRGISVAAGEFTWLGLMDDVELVRDGYELASRSGFLRAYSELAVWLRRLGHGAAHEGPAPPPHALELAGDPRGAADEWEKMGLPYQQALTLAFSGDAVLMRRSLDLLEELGASAPRDRVRQMMRDRGLHVGRRKAATTRSNPDGLTTRQIEVLTLLAEDLTDREIAERLFISPKTVGHHVSAILTKLGVSSRREASRHLSDK